MSDQELIKVKDLVNFEILETDLVSFNETLINKKFQLNNINIIRDGFFDAKFLGKCTYSIKTEDQVYPVVLESFNFFKGKTELNFIVINQFNL